MKRLKNACWAPILGCSKRKFRGILHCQIRIRYLHRRRTHHCCCRRHRHLFQHRFQWHSLDHRSQCYLSVRLQCQSQNQLPYLDLELRLHLGHHRCRYLLRWHCLQKCHRWQPVQLQRHYHLHFHRHRHHHRYHHRQHQSSSHHQQKEPVRWLCHSHHILCQHPFRLQIRSTHLRHHLHHRPHLDHQHWRTHCH
uniref:Uncharacterized protein n=1 Tax=Triticum urartu TaxID=4572 RepID=A0A8R7TE93_TRIUA